ncbi:MAG TPA: hypothetical protein PLK48_05935 [Caldisericia bacterium]|nr:hypothetical protein [Caldisericia bacterium]HOP95754.1 hypothetical protein [Dictyoglomaceae bacterium]HPU44121.1 hypothetical protein [Dictyoglomaceae bacterium]
MNDLDPQYEMYKNKPNDYFIGARFDLISLIPPNFHECKVLEIGCGNGATLNALKSLSVAKEVV